MEMLLVALSVVWVILKAIISLPQLRNVIIPVLSIVSVEPVVE